MAPVDLIAAMAASALGDEQSLGPALVQEKPRRPKLAQALSEPALAVMYPSVPHPKRLALAAGLLQVHDFWDASHDAAQQADDRGERATSAYWHGIAHRREPDASNAAYWFRRVGKHPVFIPLAEAARPLFAAEGLPAVAEKLIAQWRLEPIRHDGTLHERSRRHAAGTPGTADPAPGDVALARGELRGDLKGLGLEESRPKKDMLHIPFSPDRRELGKLAIGGTLATAALVASKDNILPAPGGTSEGSSSAPQLTAKATDDELLAHSSS